MGTAVLLRPGWPATESPLPKSPITRAGVGKSSRRLARRAGREAALAALEELDGLRPDLLLVFATTGLAQQELLDGVAEVAAGVPLCGCSGEGVITQGSSDESSHAVSVMAVASEALRFTTLFVPASPPPADGDLAPALAAAVRGALADDSRLLLLFPDGARIDAAALVAGLSEALPPGLRIAGGAAGAIVETWQTYQYHDGRAHQGGVSALLISGDVVPELAVSHGCEPMGLLLTVTSAQPPRVMSIDDRPALELFRDYLDEEVTSPSVTDLVHLGLGIHLDDEAPAVTLGGPHPAASHIIRTPIGHDPVTGSLLFGGGIAEGTRVRMTRRNPDRIRQGAMDVGRQVADRHPFQEPLLVLQFDCAGRGRLFGDDATGNTVEPLQGALGRHLPWLGFHSFGEIAPLSRRSYFHNYSVVLCALYPGSSDGGAR